MNITNKAPHNEKNRDTKSIRENLKKTQTKNSTHISRRKGHEGHTYKLMSCKRNKNTKL